MGPHSLGEEGGEDTANSVKREQGGSIFFRIHNINSSTSFETAPLQIQRLCAAGSQAWAWPRTSSFAQSPLGPSSSPVTLHSAATRLHLTQKPNTLCLQGCGRPAPPSTLLTRTKPWKGPTRGMALLEEKTPSTGLLGSVSGVKKAVRKLTCTP